jgi:hypothetical protein
MPGESIEVSIVVEHGRILSDGDGRNETVNELSHRGTSSSTRAIEFGGRFEISQPSHGEARQRQEAPPQPRAFAAASCSGQEFHDDRLGGRDWQAALQKVFQREVGRMTSGTKQVDPR